MKPWIERSLWSLALLGAVVGGMALGVWVWQKAYGTPADFAASRWLSNAHYLNLAVHDGLGADAQLSRTLLLMLRADTPTVVYALGQGALSEHYADTVRRALRKLDANPLVKADQGPNADNARLARECAGQATDAAAEAECVRRLETTWAEQEAEREAHMERMRRGRAKHAAFVGWPYAADGCGAATRSALPS